jgi:hypothetical protein
MVFAVLTAVIVAVEVGKKDAIAPLWMLLIPPPLN